MSARDENCHSDEHRASLTRLLQLAEPTIQFKVATELEQLHHAEAWNQTSGQSSKTLGKYADFRIVLVSIEGKHSHGPTSGRWQDFDSVPGRETSHPSFSCTKSGNGGRGCVGPALWDSSRCRGSGRERISPDDLPHVADAN